MTLMNSGVLTRTSDRTWQRDVTLGVNCQHSLNLINSS